MFTRLNDICQRSQLSSSSKYQDNTEERANDACVVEHDVHVCNQAKSRRGTRRYMW